MCYQINNGFSIPSFNVKRGVRQGDSLFPSLFIIVLGLLALTIRNSDQIKGIAVDGSEIKLVIFADDMRSFVRSKPSHRTLVDTIDLFSTYSGLKVNHDKTEILLLGNMEVSSSELGLNEIIKVLKVLGVYFTFNHSLCYKLNYESIEKSLRIVEGLELERTYTTWKNPSDQVFRHTKDLIQGCSYFKQERVYQKNTYFIIFFCLERKR